MALALETAAAAPLKQALRRGGDEPTPLGSANALMFEFFKHHPKRS